MKQGVDIFYCKVGILYTHLKFGCEDDMKRGKQRSYEDN